MKSRAIFKFNNGNGALLCSDCSVIIKTGKDYTYYEIEASKGNEELEAQHCAECKQKRIEKDAIRRVQKGTGKA